MVPQPKDQVKSSKVNTQKVSLLLELNEAPISDMSIDG